MFAVSTYVCSVRTLTRAEKKGALRPYRRGTQAISYERGELLRFLGIPYDPPAPPKLVPPKRPYARRKVTAQSKPKWNERSAFAPIAHLDQKDTPN